MKKMSNTTKRLRSLKWGLVGIVVGCWLVPMTFILIVLANNTIDHAKEQLNIVVDNGIKNSTYSSVQMLQMLISSSRNATYNETINEAYRRYQYRGDWAAFNTSVEVYFTREYKFDSNIKAALLFLREEPDKRVYTFNTSQNRGFSTVTEYLRNAHESVVKLSENLDTKIAFFATKQAVYMVRNMVDNQYKPYATLIFDLNTDNIFGGFENMAWCTGGTIYLNNTQYVLELGGEENVYPAPYKYSLANGTFRKQEVDDQILVEGRESIDGCDMLYTLSFDSKAFLSASSDFGVVFFLMFVMLVPIILIIVVYFYLNILTPIRHLEKGSEEIQLGNLGYEIKERIYNTEFRYLTESFNAMSSRLKKQFEKIYDEELALRDAKIMALQMQINPHFLNNTLEIINWESRLGNNAKVGRMIEALSDLLDAAMDRKKRPLIPLNQELMYLESYLYIISERFGKRLTIEKEIDRSLLQYKVPRLIMQPITENAIEHGVGRRQTGKITIRIYSDEQKNHIILSVENNTPLLEADQKKIEELLAPDADLQDKRSGHLGIYNVNMRLKMLYGNDAGLKIAGVDGKTLSNITIPLQK